MTASLRLQDSRETESGLARAAGRSGTGALRRANAALDGARQHQRGRNGQRQRRVRFHRSHRRPGLADFGRHEHPDSQRRPERRRIALVFTSVASDLVGSATNPGQNSNVYVRDTTTGQTTLVSVTPDGSAGNGNSYDPMISPDGRYVAFLSQATNLTDIPASNASLLSGEADGNLYIRDLQTQTTTLVDQTAGGIASDGGCTDQFVFSPDSSILAFIDTSDNLTNAPVESGSTLEQGSLPPGSYQPPSYVYVFNLADQTTSLVSVSTDGKASGSNPESIDGPTIPTDLEFSPDSKSLVFGSTATDLTTNPPDSVASSDAAGSFLAGSNLFIRNLAAGTTTLLSVTANGQLASGSSFGAVFSPDGNSVAFSSYATDLTTNKLDPTLPPEGDAGLPEADAFVGNLFVRNLTTGTTTAVTVTPGGMLSSGTAGEPVFSPDGKSLAFTSTATDLTSNKLDTAQIPGLSSAVPFIDQQNNVFLSNLSTGAITLVSATPGGMLSSGSAGQIVFSPDGSLIAFYSNAGDLTSNTFEVSPPQVPGSSSDITAADQSEVVNVFVRNLAAQTTTLATVTTSGQLANAFSDQVFFSPDSKTLFFSSGAIDLTSNPPDTTSETAYAGVLSSNLFARDLSTGTTTLISATTDGQLSGSYIDDAFLSPDGQTLYFDSSADNLTPGDSNQASNIFAATAPYTATNQIQFLSWQTSAQETAGHVVVSVTRSGPTTAAASVNYTVQNGSAVAGTDFKATSGTLSFPAGATSETFTVPLISSDHFSGTKTAELVLSNPQGASLGYPTAMLDLTAPAAAVTTTPPIVLEPGPVVTGVAPGETRGGKSTLVITFDQPLDPTSAVTIDNYLLTVPKPARRSGAASRGDHLLSIKKVEYNSTTHQVTLTLRSRVTAQRDRGTVGQGNFGWGRRQPGQCAGSPDTGKPGQDYTDMLDVGSRRR